MSAALSEIVAAVRARQSCAAPPESEAVPAKKPKAKKKRATVQPRAHRFDRADHVELACTLVEDLGGGDDLVFDELHPWKFDVDAGVWRQVDRAHESRIVQSYAGEPIGDGQKVLDLKAGDVTGAIKLAHDQIAHPEYFAQAPAGLVFTNGFVRVTDAGQVELAPHSPEHRARASYPFAFERGALPRGFLAFLSALFRDDEDRLEKELCIQEFFGACALGIAPRYQRSMIAVGGGDNGKSRLADGMLSTMPHGTTSAIPPQEWGQDYKRAMLVGKRLNAVGELPERDIIASEAFKAIVAGDPIVARVIRESPLMFRPIAGHYFAANRLPGTPDQTEGFWRRFIVLTFNRSFKGDPSRDPNVMDRILATETPAIVSWLIEGGARVVREREYTIPKSHHAALAEWRKNADQIALFVESETRALRVDEPDAWGTSGESLYGAYRRWCESNGHRSLASNRFAERMKGLGFPAKRTRRGALYPVALLSASDRAEVTGSDGRVTGHPSPKSWEVANA